MCCAGSNTNTTNNNTTNKVSIYNEQIPLDDIYIINVKEPDNNITDDYHYVMLDVEHDDILDKSVIIDNYV